MHVLTKKSLERFWVIHDRARKPLEAWLKRTRKAAWKTFDDLCLDFPQSNRYGRFVIFDIGGNKYRLIATVHYNRQKLYVRQVLTHAEYTRGHWKNE